MKYYLSSVILFEEVVNALKPRKIVVLDIRKRYVGVAITDLNFDRAYPHSCLERKDNNGELALQIHHERMGAGSLIIGQPNDGRMKNPDITLVQNFVNDLKKTRKFNGVKYAYVEELYEIRFIDRTNDRKLFISELDGLPPSVMSYNCCQFLHQVQENDFIKLLELRKMIAETYHKVHKKLDFVPVMKNM
ncbi:zinc finger, CCHC-type containing protein [Tanacetum coccineum]